MKDEMTGAGSYKYVFQVRVINYLGVIGLGAVDSTGNTPSRGD
jgi:hypothetical protein